MANRYHSRVFAVVDWFNEQLTDATWPPHPTTNLTPDVGVGESNQEGVEHIDVIYRIDDDATMNWVVSSPPGRDEDFAVDVLIRSLWSGVEREVVWARLAEMAEVVQGIVVDPTGTTLQFRAPGEKPWSVNLGGVARVSPQAWRTDEGWVGDCVVTFRVRTRI